MNYIRHFAKVLQSALQAVYTRIPIPIRLREGIWWITSNDVMSRHIRDGNDFESSERVFLLNFLQRGMIVLDIGAHHGLYSLLTSTKVGSVGRVIAFEPSPRERRRLQLHVRINRRRNITVESLALGQSEGTDTLYLVLGQETGCNSLKPPAILDRTVGVPVSVTRLDSYLEKNKLNQIDFFKMDVEGAELEVLKGAINLLTHQPKPVILYELADIRTQPWNYQSVEVYDLLASYNYDHFSITQGGRLIPCPRKEHFHENLLAVPHEKLDAIIEFIGKTEL